MTKKIFIILIFLLLIVGYVYANGEKVWTYQRQTVKDGPAFFGIAIVKDPETEIEYIIVNNGDGLGITPRLKPLGKSEI